MKKYKIHKDLRLINLMVALISATVIIATLIVSYFKFNFVNLNVKAVIIIAIIMIWSILFLIFTKDNINESEESLFNTDRHILLYAKGYYKKNNIIDDIAKIIQYELELKNIDNKFIYKFVCFTMCIYCEKAEVARYLTLINEKEFDYSKQIEKMLSVLTESRRYNHIQLKNIYKPKENLLELAEI